MSLQSRLSALITAVGADVKALQARSSGYFGDGSDGAWTAQVTPTNVLVNPNPDVNTLTWNGFFTGGGSGFGPNRVADAAFGGSFAFEIGETAATGAGVILQYPGGTASFIGGANVVPGQVVDFSGQVKAQAGAFTSLKLTARWMKADGSLISEVDVTGAAQNAPVVGTVYALSGSLTAPPLAAYAGVEVIGSFAGAGSYTARIANLASRPIMPGSTRVGAVYTLTRDVYFTDLVVNTGVSIVTHGYRIYCRGTLSGAGTISNDGLASASRTAGVRAQPGSVEGGYAGADGGLTSQAGSTAGPVAYGHGGIGGAGGASAGFAGGLQPTTPTAPVGGIRRALPELIKPFFWNFNAAAFQVIAGGGGGSGGGGSATGSGGGGGGGGGVVVIAARTLSGTIAFTAKGGAGAVGSAGVGGGTNGGGGGGGAGGAIHLIYGDKTGWTGTTDVTGGAAGAGNGTGSAGIVGGAGNVIQLAVAYDAPVQQSVWGPWIALPFAANWGNYGSSNQDGQYRVSVDGKNVQLRGLIKITGATITLGGANANPTTLPAGARPPAPAYFSQYVVAAGTTNTTVLIGIGPNGLITMWSELSGRALTLSTGTYMSLDAIEFSTEV